MAYITNTGGASITSGAAASRPVATGSGNVYICDDVPVIYLDDKTAVAWKQYGTMGYVPGPGLIADWTAIGNLGLTQKGDSILGTCSSSGNSCMLKSVGSPTVPYAVEMMGFHNYQVRITYPQFGVGFTNGNTSGTSTIAFIGRYASSNGWGAFHDTIGSGQAGKLTISSQDNNYDLIQPSFALHVRVIYDGTSFMYQISSDGEGWRLWTTENAPFTPTYYGALIGTDQGAGVSGALVTKLNLRNLTTSTITNMVYNSGTTTVTTSGAHGLATGMSIAIRDVSISAGASPDSIYDSSVTSTGTSTFTVPTLSFTYTSGGTVLNISQ